MTARRTVAAGDRTPEAVGIGLAEGGGVAATSRGLRDLARRLPVLAAPLLAFLAALAVGAAAVQPGVGFWDTAEFQVVGPVLGTAHPTGFPAYILLGWLASAVLQPLGEPAFRMNLLSTILVAVAASMLAVLVRLLTGRTWLAVAAGIVLATTPTVWSLATRADPHAFLLAAASIVLVLLVAWEREVAATVNEATRSRTRADRLLLAASIAYGVALAGHSLAALLAPGIGLFVLAADPSIRRRPRDALPFALAVCATLGGLYLELPLRALTGAPLVYDHPDTPIGFLAVALGAQFSGTLAHQTTDLGAKLAGFVDVAAAQLGPLAAVVPVAGAVTAYRLPRYALLTVPGALLITAFAAAYTNADIGRYYAIPLLIALSWLAVLGAALVDALQALVARAVAAVHPDRPGRQGRSGLRRPALPSWPLDLLVAGILVAPSVVAAPARFALVDQRANTAAADWLDAVLATLPPHAVVVSWWDYSTTLWYGQLIEGRRPDIWIVDDRTRLDQELGDVSDVIASQLGRRPVYLIRMPDEMPALEARYVVRHVSNVPGPQSLDEVLGTRSTSSLTRRP